MTLIDMLNAVFGTVPDITVLRLLIFLLLAAVLVLIVPSIRIFEHNRRLAKAIGLIVATIAAVGMPDDYVLGIVTGYSWGAIALFALLPVVGIVALLLMRGSGPGIWFVRFFAIAILLFILSSFYRVLTDTNPQALSIGRDVGVPLGDIFQVVSVLLVIMLLYTGYEAVSGLVFAEEQRTG